MRKKGILKASISCILHLHFVMYICISYVWIFRIFNAQIKYFLLLCLHKNIKINSIEYFYFIKGRYRIYKHVNLASKIFEKVIKFSQCFSLLLYIFVFSPPHDKKKLSFGKF
jgi:hypothetical protein